MLDEYTQRRLRNAHERALAGFREEYASMQQEVSEAIRDLTAMRKERDQLKGRLGHMRKTTVSLPLDADGEVVRPDVSRMWKDSSEEVEVRWLMVTSDVELSMWKAMLDDGTTYEVRDLHLERPVLDRDGLRIRVGDTVYDHDGTPHVVESVSPDYDGDESTVFCGEYTEMPVDDCALGAPEIPISHIASDLTHERPDSWERIAEDAGGEIAERIRALAGVGDA